MNFSNIMRHTTCLLMVVLFVLMFQCRMGFASITSIDFESVSPVPLYSGGDANWTHDATEVQQGSRSLKSGAITHNQYSEVSITVDMALDGEVSFWFKVSSESGYDYLEFWVDGVKEWGRSGEVGWEKYTHTLTSGRHTLAWRYDKDGSVSRNADAAWIDDIIVDSNGGWRLSVTQANVANCSDIIETYVSVSNPSGAVIGLTRDHFTVLEDGMVPSSFTLSSIQAGNQNIAASILLDYSGSMSYSDIDDLEIAAKEFIGNMGANDEGQIIKFARGVQVMQDFTTNQTLLNAAVDTPDQISGGSTSLYDAIHKGVTDVAKQNGLKAVIAMTDGHSNYDSYTLQEVINYANANSIPIYTIGLGSADTTTLENIATSTNGAYYYAASSADLLEIYQSISQNLSQHYLIRYRTLQNEGGSHEVYVECNYGAITVYDTKTFKIMCTSPFIVPIFELLLD